MVMSHSVVPEYGLLGSCQVDVTLGRCLSAGYLDCGGTGIWGMGGTAAQGQSYG
jgi:hypothetical protein